MLDRPIKLVISGIKRANLPGVRIVRHAPDFSEMLIEFKGKKIFTHVLFKTIWNNLDLHVLSLQQNGEPVYIEELGYGSGSDGKKRVSVNWSDDVVQELTRLAYLKTFFTFEESFYTNSTGLS
jgi:hypothetical protein